MLVLDLLVFFMVDWVISIITKMDHTLHIANLISTMYGQHKNGFFEYLYCVNILSFLLENVFSNDFQQVYLTLKSFVLI